MTTTNFAPRKGMSEAEIASTVEDILAEASLTEKVAMMSGRGFFQDFADSGKKWGARPYRAGAGCERLGVPALWFTDGPRGVARGQSTCFPVTMARGAAWDRDLERRVGEAMAIEIRAQDCNLTGAVCINLLRHPGWGRAQETYGEDPFHVGELGAALATGIQTHNVLATVKHFAMNSIENARFKIDVRCDARTLREVYLAHFKRVLDAGCASVMSAYNKVNGEYCGQNRDLLTNILRHEWGFTGFVHSDWIRGVYEPYGAAAGLDIENPEPIHFGAKLVGAVESGTIEPAVVDTAGRRILRTLYRFAAAEDPLEEYPLALVASEAHRALAREAAEKSAVLLTNNATLPLAKTSKIALFGKLAALVNTGDHGSSRVDAPFVITPLQGIADYLGTPGLQISGDESDCKAASQAARDADAAIVVVGYTAKDEGEYIPGEVNLGQEQNVTRGPVARGGDRDRLRLPDEQIALIKAVAAANAKTIVVIIAGSAVIVEEWRANVGAILQTFYAGMEGGHALARLIYGDVSPSGKLPFSVARDESDYPFFDKNADSITYGPYHGYTLFDREQTEPAFAFGHGLSYASFTYRALRARRSASGIEAQISVRNDGAVQADEIVQLYIGFPGVAVERPKRLLRGFERISLKPGETRSVHFTIPDSDLCYWNEASATWVQETGEHSVMVGGSSRREDLKTVTITL